MIETSQLQTLMVVATAGSFSKAAEQLGVTQSAISQSIKTLETKVGVKLFRRSGKKVVLTSEGEKLFAIGGEFLESLNKTLDEIKYDSNSMSGKVRIGALTGIGKTWVAPELLEISKSHPELVVDLTLGFEDDIIAEFESHKLDVVILVSEKPPQVGKHTVLGKEEIVFVYPDREEFQSINDEISMEELLSFPTILFSHSDPLYQKWISTHYGKKPKNINARYVINSHGNMLHAVNQGLGVAVMPKHVLERSYFKEKVKILREKESIESGTFYLVYHEESKDLLRIKTVIQTLKDDQNLL